MAREGYIAIAVDNSCCEIGMVQGCFFSVASFPLYVSHLIEHCQGPRTLLHSGVCAPYFHSAFTVADANRKASKTTIISKRALGEEPMDVLNVDDTHW